MSDITLLEYHSHGDGPHLFPGFLGGEDAGETEEMADEEDDSGGRSLAPILALVLVVGIAVGYRYLRSGEEGEAFESEQVEVTEYES